MSNGNNNGNNGTTTTTTTWNGSKPTTSWGGNKNSGKKSGLRKGFTKGFTLIEILIVVVILGVLAALVVPSVTGALDDANIEAAEARGGQITTMVTRLNQFQPGGASITLTDGSAYSSTDLAPLVTAGYCSNDDLVNQVDSSKGWVWTASTRRFTPEN